VSTWSIGSLGLVGEIFEVRAQVDRDLTIVSRVDRQLRLIKNLGRHSLRLPLLSVSATVSERRGASGRRGCGALSPLELSIRSLRNIEEVSRQISRGGREMTDGARR
jgi:hypothetical protein